MGNPAAASRFAIREPRNPRPMNPNRLCKVIFSSRNIDSPCSAQMSALLNLCNCTCLANWLSGEEVIGFQEQSSRCCNGTTLRLLTERLGWHPGDTYPPLNR